MSLSSSVVLLAGGIEPAATHIATAVLTAGGKVAAAVTRSWQVDKLREALAAVADDRLFVSAVGIGDTEAAAGFVKGTRDVLGDITHFFGASRLLRQRVPGKEPAGDGDELLAANLAADTVLCRAALASMRRSKAGRIVFVDAPDDVADLSVTCRASLAARTAFAEALAGDLSGSGIDIAMLPAPTDSAEDDPVMARWLAAAAVGGATS